MTKIISIVALFFYFKSVHAQVQQVWVTSHIFDMHEMVVDAAGNTYVAGRGVLFKHDKNGNTLWSAGEGVTGPTAMAVDAAGNVYITGNGFHVGFGHVYQTVKFNSNGSRQWTSVLEDRVESIATAIAVDLNGDVYVTGGIYKAYTEEGFPVLDQNSADYATVKYRGSDGDQMWVRYYNGASPGEGFDQATAIVTDAVGNVYVSGNSQLNGQIDIATIKYSPTGTVLWEQRYDDPGFNDNAADMKLDAAGNIIVAGAKISGSTADIKVLKYTFSGFLLWARNGFNAMNGERRSTDLVIDNAGNAIILAEGHHMIVTKFNPAGERLWLNQSLALGGRREGIATDGVDIYLAGLGTGTTLTTVKLNGSGVEQWRMSLPTTANDITVRRVGVDANLNVYSSSTPGMLTVRYSQCGLTCPQNKVVNNDPGECGAVVTFADATTTGDCGATFSYSHESGDFFPIGTTTVTVTSDETGATCSFTITVNDAEKPIITFCPSSKTVNTGSGVCYATASSVNAGEATATDNCRYTLVSTRSDGLSPTANYPVGNTIIKWTATDASNNTATCSQTITVVDNQPPIVSNESASTYVLSPPNHTMRDITINYTATDNCAVTSTLTVTSNEPINGVGDGDTDPDWVVVNNHQVQLRAERSAGGDGRIYTVTITAIDPSGNTATKTIEIRVPHDIRKPHSGQTFKVGSTVSFLGEFWDTPGNKHTAKWMIDENTIAKATVTEPLGNKNGTVTGSYKFNTPGVYKLQLNVTDQNGITHFTNTAGDLEAIVVIYDPNGGHTYGGGYFNSPAEALTSDPISTGKASYGFAMNYFKNSTYPKGEAQFEFKVGDFEFNALNFDYLVISNSMAQFKGTGKIIDGQSGIGFTMTVVDGELDGTGVDKIRMKIYNKNNGKIIYDNQPGASDAALPIAAVGTNSVIVIQGANGNPPTTKTTSQQIDAESKTVNGLALTVYPNPASNYFNILVGSNNTKEKIVLQVFDQYGRLVEAKSNVSNGSMVRLGDLYRTGVYYVRVVQGKQYKEQKLIKFSE